MRHIKCTCYITSVFEPAAQKVVVKELCRLLRDKKFKNVNCIVGCGLSGTPLASIVAHKLGKMLTIIRKGEKAHTSFEIEGIPVHDNMRYVIIDDLISSGDTIKRINNVIHKEVYDAEFVGLLLYHHSVGYKPTEAEPYPPGSMQGIQKLEDTNFPAHWPFIKPKYVAGFGMDYDTNQQKWIVTP
jgi:orotate phosphoribosyltransferase